MKLLVIGVDGQLGGDFARLAGELGCQTVEPIGGRFDVADETAIAAALDAVEFDVIVNTSAYHGHRAYEDTSPERHLAVNAQGPYYLARYAERREKALLHFSTDYVFSGREPAVGEGFRESDRPAPTNLYGASKLAGETLVGIPNARVLICRVASLYGRRGCKAKGGQNFVETVIAKLSRGERMQVVDDIVMSPTSTASVVRKSIELLAAGKSGLFHLAGSGSCSWYELAVEIASCQGLPVELVARSSTENVVQEIQRGKNTALSNSRLIEEGLADLPPWRASLREYLAEREGDRR